MVNGDLTRYPVVGCPCGARTGEPRAKAGARYCEPGWGPTCYVCEGGEFVQNENGLTGWI